MMKNHFKKLAFIRKLLSGVSNKPLYSPPKQPVFIVGTGRCGTSLLVRMLSSNPQISDYPGEANKLWHPTLYPYEKTSIESPPIEMDIETFTKISISHWPKHHDEKIKQAFGKFHAEAGPDKRFLAKSAMISFMMPKIKSIFPDAKFIHIYRYGPSVIESYFNKNHGKYSNHQYTKEQYHRACEKYWNDCILRIEQDKNRLSLANDASFYELSYESLCRDPQNILKDLATFMNVDRDQFTFDLSNIQSTNFKAMNIEKQSASPFDWELIKPAMTMKGYLKTTDPQSPH